MAFPADYTATPPVAAPPTPTTAAGVDTPAGDLRVATYNLGGANAHAKLTDNIRSSTQVLAAQMVDGGLDVAALQEIDVGTDDAYRTSDEANEDAVGRGDGVGLPDGFDDYNEYALAQVSAQEAGLYGGPGDSAVSFTRTEGVDSHGTPTVTITGVDVAGRRSQVTITRELFTADGQRLAPDAGEALTVLSAIIGHDDLLPLTVYTAQVSSPAGLREYSAVYGPSRLHDGGSYGNSILLGPGARLQRDADGNLAAARHDLGANDPETGENRSALQVGIEAGGEALTVFNAHLSYETTEVEGYQEGQRGQQVETLASLVAAAGGNTLLLGDFNSDGFGAVGPLSGGNYDANYVARDVRDQAAERRQALGLPGDSNIDRIYASADIDVGADDRREFIAGGSDHEMVAWDVDLDPQPPASIPHGR